MILVWCAMPLALIGTVRDFGYDLSGIGGVRTIYPWVADGWGVWYWFAQLGLDFNVYFFIVSLALAAGILLLAFPGYGQKYSKPVSLTILIYLVFWFLFAHTRYGMSVVLVALAVGANSLWILALAGAAAFFFHRAIAGAVLLLGLWLMLRKQRHGLMIAAALCALLTYFFYLHADKLLLLAAYDNYTSWDTMPNANTQFKYEFDILILCIWKYFDRKAPNSLLILALLFLPTAFYNVFAGRAHEVYTAVFLSGLLTAAMPRWLKYLLLAEFLADISLLIFASGAFF
jgi:hypothetical protein